MEPQTSVSPSPHGADDKTPSTHMAIRYWPAVTVFLLITVVGLVADLWSKHAVFEWLLSDPAIQAMVEQKQLNELTTPDEAVRRYALPLDRQVFGEVRFRISTNPGVVFGLPMPRAVVAVISILTIGLVFLFFAVGDRRAWSMHIGLACIMAGALGNLYDRLFGAVFIPGFGEPITNQVRDFIDLSGYTVWGLSYGYIFNIADVLLVLGVILLIVNWWTFRKHEKAAKAKAK
ncbi:MAG: signal peptidase II [Phycisphaerae bacterium]|nr:signal peptidase II [Phycisphaerae bacterium]